eukprot:6212821-Pleurochrysis_carterae.AAC.1
MNWKFEIITVDPDSQPYPYNCLTMGVIRGVQASANEPGVQNLVPAINDLSGQLPQLLEQKFTPRDLANNLALLNHAGHLADDDVFIVIDDVADYLLHAD